MFDPLPPSSAAASTSGTPTHPSTSGNPSSSTGRLHSFRARVVPNPRQMPSTPSSMQVDGSAPPPPLKDQLVVRGKRSRGLEEKLEKCMRGLSVHDPAPFPDGPLALKRIRGEMPPSSPMEGVTTSTPTPLIAMLEKSIKAFKSWSSSLQSEIKEIDPKDITLTASSEKLFKENCCRLYHQLSNALRISLSGYLEASDVLDPGHYYGVEFLSVILNHLSDLNTDSSSDITTLYKMGLLALNYHEHLTANEGTSGSSH